MRGRWKSQCRNIVHLSSLYRNILLYCYIQVNAWIYIYIYWIHTDAMIKTHAINDTHRKTQEDFFIKYFTSHFICKVSKRVTKSLHVRGSWRPNITEIFWPQSYGRHRCVFLVLYGCSTGALSLLTTLIQLLSNYTACPQLYSPVFLLFNSSALYYLQTPTRWYGHGPTPPQLLPISSDRDVSLPLPLEWPVWSSSSGNNCHAVQRSLSSGASVYESIMGFFFTSSHFISQFPSTRFPLITAIRMCHFLPVHHLEWHLWPGQQVKT